MIGYAGFLLADLPAGGRDWENARRLMRAADHAKKLVRQILSYSRGEKTERHVVDLRGTLGEIGTLVQASLPSSTLIEIDLMSDPAPALVNESEIFQVILNLCINANDALEGEPGRITISLSPAEAATIEARRDGPAPPALVTGGKLAPDRAYLRIRVTDDGVGMDQETLSRIFEPFFTTKDRGRGTGLGLAVVYGIITAHEGAYVVASRRNVGTNFDIYLPLDTRLPEEPVEQTAAAEPRGHESVLVIDDDGDLLEMMATGLARYGYEVTGTDDPVDALESVTTDPGAWDVVVSDHVMPGMKGLDLVAAIKRVRPDCPVILCTGFSENMTEAHALAAGADAFFLKPVEPTTIARQIRALLDRDAGQARA